MAAYVAGQRPSFAELVRRYERELYSYLRRIVGNDALAEDVFQTTFLQVHLKRHLYEAGRSFRPWLYTIASHQAIDALRRNRRHARPSLDGPSRDAEEAGSLLELLADDGAGPGEEAERQERRRLVREVVDGLADHLRTVLVLCYYQGMKYKEIADVLKIPVGTVKSRLHAAVHKLGEEWRRLGFSEGE